MIEIIPAEEEIDHIEEDIIYIDNYRINCSMHEYPGIIYLRSIGYEYSDMMLESSCGCPDIRTKSDNKGWEVKILRHDKYIYFTFYQLYMDDDTNILIFKKGNIKPENVIKFWHMKYNKCTKYKCLVSFTTDIMTAYERRDDIREVLKINGTIDIEKCITNFNDHMKGSIKWVKR